MIPDRRFRPEPMTALEAIEWLKTHRYVWYQAPFDHSPSVVHLTSKLTTWKRDSTRFSVGVEANTQGGFLKFRIDNGHLDRLRMPFEMWHHGITATVRHVDYVGKRHQIVLSQSNGYHLHMDSLAHAIRFAKLKALELTVRYRKRVRVLVKARPPISGERTF